MRWACTGAPVPTGLKGTEGMTTKAGSGPLSLVREIIAIAAFGALVISGNHSGGPQVSTSFSPLVLTWPGPLGGAAYAAPSANDTAAARMAGQPMSRHAVGTDALQQ